LKNIDPPECTAPEGGTAILFQLQPGQLQIVTQLAVSSCVFVLFALPFWVNRQTLFALIQGLTWIWRTIFVALIIGCLVGAAWPAAVTFFILVVIRFAD
jgi:hypothetical protein